MKLKQKDIISLLVAITIFTITGVLAYSLLKPKGSNSGSTTVQVLVVTPISGTFNERGKSDLTDPTVTRDFTPAIDLTTGLGNPQLFGSF